MKLRKGYVACPDGGGGKGRCGYKQRLPRSVSTCPFCSHQGSKASSVGLPDVDVSSLGSAEEPQATVGEDGRLDFSELKGRDRVAAMQNELAEGVASLTVDKESMDRYLDFVKSSYNYSINNQLLIHMQDPNAVNCKTYKQWQALGYQVNKGAKSIQVLRPYIKNVDVLDSNGNPVLDEDGKPKQRSKVVGYGSYGVFSANSLDRSVKAPPVDPLAQHLYEFQNRSDVENNPAMQKDIAAVAEKLGVSIKYSTPKEDSTLASGASAYIIRNDDGDDGKATIVVNPESKPHALSYMMAHELGHYLCGHMDPKTRPEDRRRREVEAESVAYAISRDYGLDTGSSSFAYLKGWSGDDPSKIRQAMGTVTKSMSTYYSTLEKVLGGGGQTDELSKAREAGAAKAAEKAKARKAGAKRRKK